MIVSKAPMRVSLFGGSTDYKSFYEKHGSFIIGTTINKYAYNTIRYRPAIVGDDTIIKYSKIEIVKTVEDIHNPLIRETLKYYNVKRPVELNFDSDIPSRTGLGGSSSCCASLARSVSVLMGIPFSPEKLCKDAIKIEREILNEPGGIQDQIWACYGGFNSITILQNGEYHVEPMPVSKLFLKQFKRSLVMIYSNRQREMIDGSHANEEEKKLTILNIAKEAYQAFKEEDIERVGKLLYESWLMKKATSSNISTDSIDFLIDEIMNAGAYGAKLLGNGGGGFILAVCSEGVRKKLKEIYKEDVLDFHMSKGDIKTIIV